MKGRLRELLDREEYSYGCFVTLSDPAVVEVAALVGYDFVIIDMEHGAIGVETLTNHLRAAEARGIGSLVRVRSAHSWDVLPALEAGAEGILIPHVHSVEVAKRAADAVRYSPRGHRGVYDAVRAGDYSARASDGYSSLTEGANRHIVLVILIEDAEGVANINEIVGVDGVDLVLVGPADLSYSLGRGGAVSDPDVVAAVHRVRDACFARHVRFAVPPDHDMYPVSPAELKEWGVHFLMRGSDTNALVQGMAGRLARMRGTDA